MAVVLQQRVAVVTGNCCNQAITLIDVQPVTVFSDCVRERTGLIFRGEFEEVLSSAKRVAFFVRWDA